MAVALIPAIRVPRTVGVETVYQNRSLMACLKKKNIV